MSGRANQINIGASGLFVIGGDTTNFVGLGWCKPENFVEGMDNYCANCVLQSPTMWLGIFLGGCVFLFA